MADLFQTMLENLGSLTQEQQIQILSKLQNMTEQKNLQDSEGLLVEDSKIISCPHCGSVDVRKHGKKDGTALLPSSLSNMFDKPTQKNPTP